ncbi:L-type lectin-domain containing receptor kinase IX.1-like [Macadamia integrifolia]|uniref:L-type lectin-domain containing receptor kinase IX.1-like n=1 Tax=Macadamia integrifolia TaxID=60698 RepID=UPI001C4F8A31|nr:L-type lectin-domain containing receptor kinase IX.1-like [Macadamia integrifolia]
MALIISSGNCNLLLFPKLCNYFILFQGSAVYCFLLLLLVLPPSTSVSFNFSSFNPSVFYNIIKTQGDASPSGSIIDLTRNRREQSVGNSVGGVYYNDPVQLWDMKTGNLTNFTTHFSFTIGNASTDCSNTCFGDGLAFFLAPNTSVIQDYNGGGGLGLFNNTVPGNTPLMPTNNSIIAVEFDSYQNSWDPDNNHIGIDISSVKSVINTSCDFDLWYSMRKHSAPWEAWVVYDSTSLNLSVVLTGCIAHNATSYCRSCSLDYIVDLKEYLPEHVFVGFSSSTGSSAELHQLNSWDFSSSLVFSSSLEINNSNNIGIVVGLSVGGAVAMITVLGLFWFIRRRKKQQRKAEDDVLLDLPTGPREFTFAELARATRNFDEEQKLGEGGFGGVYRGFLSDLNKDIAVKRISKGSKQGKKEYASEVKIISRLRHRKLVQLIGWCHQQKELLLVYEFMPNGSLDFHLFRNRGSLTWDLRYKIALDLASALQYLHEGWEQCIVHRDIKSSNVILDTSFNAKLGDFGLARLVEHEEESQATINTIVGTIEGNNMVSQTTGVAGTMGYMAPEYFQTGRATKETDIYSFGIVLLEIACGRKSVEIKPDPREVSLVNWVWELYGTEKHLEAADPSRGMDFDKRIVECLMIVGLWCAHPDCKLRPSIEKAIQVLQFDAPLPILPTKMPAPTYGSPLPFNMSSTFSISSSQPSSNSSTTNFSKLKRSSSSPSISLLNNPR